jgi:hypothetical protein
MIVIHMTHSNGVLANGARVLLLCHASLILRARNAIFLLQELVAMVNCLVGLIQWVYVPILWTKPHVCRIDATNGLACSPNVFLFRYRASFYFEHNPVPSVVAAPQVKLRIPAFTGGR